MKDLTGWRVTPVKYTSGPDWSFGETKTSTYSTILIHETGKYHTVIANGTAVPSDQIPDQDTIKDAIAACNEHHESKVMELLERCEP